MKKLGFLFIALVGFAVSSFAQLGATTTSNASATIVTPISIVNDVPLNYGNIAVNATTGGNVVMTPDGGAARAEDGGVTLPVVDGSPTAAKFTVSGQDTYTFALTLPVGATNLTKAGETDMTVDSWTSSLGVAGTGTIAGAGTVIYVAGTLHVNAGQGAGVYNQDAPFSVTVDYN